MTEGRKRNRRGVGTEGGSRRRRRKSWKERETGPGDRKGYFDFSNVGLCFTTTHCYRTSLGSGRALSPPTWHKHLRRVRAPAAWALQGSRSPRGPHRCPQALGHPARQGAPARTRSRGRRARGAGVSSCSPFPHPSRARRWLPQGPAHGICSQFSPPFEGILRLCQNMRLRGAVFSLGWNRKPNQTSIRGMAGDPQEFLPGISSSDSHREGVPAFPRCYPGLLSQDLLQPVPTTEPPSLLPWRNWLDAILRRAGWNSLQIAILSQSAAAPSDSVSRKSVINFFFLPRLENERFCGKGLFWMHFSIWKKKKIGHNDQSGLL